MVNPLGGGNKATWYVAGGAALIVGGIVLWEHKKQAAAAATTATAGTVGYGYGSAYPSYGYGAGYGYGVSPIYGSGGGGSYPTYGYGGYGGYGYQGNPTPTTNAEWFQQAVQYLGETATVEAALSKYLAGVAVTSQQETICQEAEAAVGPPPQAGASGYPPAIKTTTSSGQGTKVPNVVGQEVDAAGRTLTSVGLVSSHPPLKSGTGYTVSAQSPKAGTTVSKGSSVKLTIKPNKK